MINPDNLEGIGMGESPYASDPVHGTFKFLTEYTDNKKDEIDAIILDPNYSLSHHVILKETEKDSRIFVTEIPEENLDDNPENDIAYDSFEIKVNYPLPYPQILGVGMRNMDYGTRENQEQKAEFEYIKKNGEYLNDFDQDEEIEEKERLKFPIWQGPDYENNDKKAYLMSNMLCNKEDVKPLDQTQFIPKNSNFRIKVFDKDVRNVAIKVKLSVGDLETYIPCKFQSEGIYYSDEMVTGSDDFQEDSILIGEKQKKYIGVNKEKSDDIKVIYKNKEINVRKSKNFLYVNSFTRFGFLKSLVIKLEKIMRDLGYMFNKNINSEKTQVIKQLNSKPDIFYYFGHTKEEILGNNPSNYIETISGLTLKSGFFGGAIENIEDKFLLKKSEIPKGDMKLVFINGCWSARKNKNYDTGEEYRKIFNAKYYLGWNEKPRADYALKIANSLFDLFNNKYKIKEAFKKIEHEEDSSLFHLRLIEAKDLKQDFEIKIK